MSIVEFDSPPSLKATLFTRVRFIMSLERLIYQGRATYLPRLVYLEFEESVEKGSWIGNRCPEKSADSF